MPVLAVFDPPMCCPTGVCGPSVNPALARFAADLDWLRGNGVEVGRYNLAQNPGAFAQNVVVRAALLENGNCCLPLILVDEKIVSAAVYPSRDDLMVFTGLSGEAR